MLKIDVSGNDYFIIKQIDNEHVLALGNLENDILTVNMYRGVFNEKQYHYNSHFRVSKQFGDQQFLQDISDYVDMEINSLKFSFVMTMLLVLIDKPNNVWNIKNGEVEVPLESYVNVDEQHIKNSSSDIINYLREYKENSPEKRRRIS